MMHWRHRRERERERKKKRSCKSRRREEQNTSTPTSSSTSLSSSFSSSSCSISRLTSVQKHILFLFFRPPTPYFLSPESEREKHWWTETNSDDSIHASACPLHRHKTSIMGRNGVFSACENFCWSYIAVLLSSLFSDLYQVPHDDDRPKNRNIQRLYVFSVFR